MRCNGMSRPSKRLMISRSMIWLIYSRVCFRFNSLTDYRKSCIHKLYLCHEQNRPDLYWRIGSDLQSPTCWYVVWQTFSNFVVPISANHGWNFDELLEKMWEYLDLVRVYTKPRGVQPDFDDPVVLRKSHCTVEDFCNTIVISSSCLN